ncbi:uncharacterized protein LOC128217436 [Mya arenaria]|uniref:uncharacterized protein LOC128217436 n=1 Tax=Mya arenaria TaxID=6604 RepID=UPI0022E8D05C|nr:uncharacterized protein LOC128217436 [Mya arenaria]
MWYNFGTSSSLDRVETACGVAVQSHFGEITSPNYPSNYPENQNCLWNITGPPGSRIMLHLINYGFDCSFRWRSFDFVQVYFDGYTSGRLCADSNQKWLTKSNRFDIFFKSSSAGIIRKRGFRLFWKGVGTTFLTSSNTSWSQAQEMCSEEGGTMLTDDTYIELSKEDLAAEMDAANVTEAWIGRYYTPWSWLKGCYTDDMLPERVVCLKSNQQSTCIEFCHDSNYFGLKGNTCYCFRKLKGQFVRTGSNCTTRCPGNTEERCGGNGTMTVYMNDLCFNNSTLWNGTISTSRSGKTCLSWNSSGIEFFDGGVDNTDNFCRDPNNTGNTWCHTRRGPEACDIPKCLGTTDNNGAYACMAFKEISGSRIQAQQTNCSWPYKAVCKYPGGIGYSVDKSPWNQGRNFCRNAELISDGTPMYSMEDTSYILPDDGNYYWVGYRRTVRTVSDLNASFLDCFRLTRNENGISLTVEKCTEGIRAVCQRMPITCGETYNEGKRGKFSFPNTTRTYDSNHNCVWKIMATPPEKIEIYIEFDLEDSVVCMCDKIKIFDNDAPKGQANKTLCGRGNFTFISSGPAVAIQFISDELVNGTGFKVSWKIEKEEPTTIRSITTVFNTQSSHTGFEEATTVFDTPTSHTGLKVWLIVVISSGSVVFVLLVIVRICCWRGQQRPRVKIEEENVFTNTVFDKTDTLKLLISLDRSFGCGSFDLISVWHIKEFAADEITLGSFLALPAFKTNLN